MSRFISVEEARHQILSAIEQTSTERVHLGQAANRYLAQPIKAPWSAPRFDNSAMDGFALQWQDLSRLPATLDIVDESAAGGPADHAVAKGQAIAISTGAAIPDGADTVVPRELTKRDGDQVIIKERPRHGQGGNIRRAGTYLAADGQALNAGSRLNGAAIGLLASFGLPIVAVHCRLRVGIISTGDELVELGQQPAEGQIVNSNAYMLEALVNTHGGQARVYPTAADDPVEINDTFAQAIAECDFVVSSGGVSVGDHDHVGAVVDTLCSGMSFWKVRMKPGKPLAFGLAPSRPRATPLIGLPGNPGSGFVGFHLFVRPAMAIAQGAALADVALPGATARLTEDIAGARRRRIYLAGRATTDEGSLCFTPFDHQSSGNPALFAGANALGIVAAESAPAKAGDQLRIHLLG